MKRPAFQFYPGDWNNNAKLKRCSHAERGIWLAVLCLFHDNEDAYGSLNWPLKDIAQAIGCKPVELKALREKGVLKGADKGEICPAYIFTPRHAGKDGDPVELVAEQRGPFWYSSRMVRDEYKAIVRAGNAREHSPIGHPKDPPDGAPKVSPNPPNGGSPKGGNGDVSSSSISSSTFSLKTQPDEPAALPGDPPKAKQRLKSFSQFMAECEAEGVVAIDMDDSIFARAAKVGIEREWVELTWARFKESYLASPKKYLDWRAVFRNAVIDNWYKFWAVNGNGEVFLTSAGKLTAKAVAA